MLNWSQGETTVSGNSQSTCSRTPTNHTDRQISSKKVSKGSYREQRAGCLDPYPFTRSRVATMTVATAASTPSLNWASTSPAAAGILLAAAPPPPAGAGGKEQEEDYTHIRRALLLPLTASSITSITVVGSLPCHSFGVTNHHSPPHPRVLSYFDPPSYTRR